MASKWNADREQKSTEPNTIKIVSPEGEHIGEIKIESITPVPVANRPTINIRKRLRLRWNRSQEQEQDNNE